MKTITAKELRDNLGEIAKRVSAGEHIRVTYRGTAEFIIAPTTIEKPSTDITSKEQYLKTLAELRAKARPSERIKNNPDLMKIYWEDMAKKYGFKS